MLYKPLGSKISDEVLSRRSYEDIGKYGGSMSSRSTLFNTSNRIIASLEEYSKYLSYIDVPHIILIGVDETKLFSLDCIYFRFYTGTKDLEIRIDLKQSLIYKLLEKNVKGSININSSLVMLYESYWRDALYCAFLKSSVDCDELVWGE